MRASFLKQTQLPLPFQDTGIPDSFPVYHYNGLKQSNHNEKVSYSPATRIPHCHTFLTLLLLGSDITPDSHYSVKDKG